MNKFYLIFLLIFFTSNLFSQNWFKNLPQAKTKTQLTLFDYKNAFYQYWSPFNVKSGVYMDNGVSVKAMGWKQFKRWEYYMESQINPLTGEFPKQTAQQVFDQYVKDNPSFKSAKGSISSTWTAIGPNSSTGGYAGVGRISCIAYHPTDNNTYWVGTASGGLWVTTNNGISWTCLTDNNGILAISDIIIPKDYATSNTIYIATGDRDHWDNRSIGVLKSTDGGNTWTSTGISYALSAGQMVNRLIIDPNNNQVIIAATTTGVYKTTNGGTTWSNRLTTTSFNDLKFKPGDFNTMYGSTLYGTIYVSTDGGATWTITLNDTNAKRIELAVSANQPGWVYAIADAADNGLYAIYKSTDSGSTFPEVFDRSTKNLLGYAPDGIDKTGDAKGQGWYDLCIAASPTDANTVLIGGVNTWRSTNGGALWSAVNIWTGSGIQNVHADKHELLFRDNGDLFEGNDGGIYQSIDNGTSWSDKTNGMLISQMYKIGVSQTVANEVIAGLQDNGTKLFSGGVWRDVKGGDGMDCLIDYTDPNVQYGTYVEGQITRTLDHWQSNFTNIEPSGAGKGAWVTPYIIDPVNNKTLYAGYADVWKTIDRGDTWTKLTTINTPNFIRSMAIAPSNNQVLYVAELYKIWKTTNGGTDWSDITGTLPVLYGDITSIAIKNDDPNTLWVTMGNYNANRVFQSTDGGITWTNISTGLPQIPAYSIIQNKQFKSQVQLYVGTELGVYFKNGANNWVLFNTGLPNVKIGEIEIYYSSNPQDSKLKAATFGRGLWETPVFYTAYPMNYVSCTTTQNNTSSINPNQINQEILGVQILMDGSLSPFNATSFTFNATGSTNPTTDITNAKLFSGTSSSFDASTQYGSTINSVNGTFTFTGNKALSDGTNYFWLTYDVPGTATLNNYLDAQCTSITVGTERTPTVTSPPGNRQIAVNYCSAGSTTSIIGYISRVRLNNIDQSSTLGTAGYEDYTSQTASMQVGTNSTLTINRSALYLKDSVLVWVDWNRDGDFTDPGENVYHSPGISSSYSFSFAPPAGAKIGITRMRIRLLNNTYLPNNTPCGDSYYGEVEDYSINVSAACTPPTTQATGFTSSALANNSMTLSWVRGNGNAVLVVAKAEYAVDTDPVNGVSYPANAAFGSGTQIGTGNYVVYNGPATSVNLTALITGTAYNYAIYEYNQATNCYLKPALTGNVTTTGPAAYCTAGTTGNDEYISNVKIGSINQASIRGTNGYQDFTSQISTLQIGSSTSAIINVFHPYDTDQILIWIDWNHDGDFTDPGENVYVSSGLFASPLTTSNFTPPANAVLGPTRMRIRLNDISQVGSNSTPCGTGSWGEVEDYTINVTQNCTTPSAPTVGAITQPTCSVATGSVVLNGLPASGTWILTRTPGGITSTGTGVSSTITGLLGGTYTFTVTSALGCISGSSLNVVINAIAASPSAPTIGTVTQPTCAVATGGVVLNGLPATGNWTLTRTPGGTTTNGSGTSSTITGLIARTYNYTVTNGSGCVSISSADVVINTQPTLVTPTSNAATNQLQTSLTANWSTSVAVTGFLLDVATDISFTSFVSGYNSKNIGNVTSYNVTGLSANTTYYYRVRAYNLCGTGINSGTITATTLQNPPVAPTANAATNIIQTSCTFSWNSPATATGYKLDVATNSSFTTFVTGYNNKDLGNVTNCSVTGLSANTTYYYRVRAYNSGGDGNNSNTITFSTLPIPPVAPVANSATGIVQTTCVANWVSSSTATGYKLDVATDNTFTSLVSGYNSKDIGNVVSSTLTGLIANTTYYYQVRAYNTGGDSQNSNTITFTTLPNPPATPTVNVASNIVQTSFTARWNSSNSATGYRIDIATNSGFTTYLSGYNDKDVSNVQTVNVTGLSAKTSYYYRVRAYNTGGTSNSSSSVTAITLTNPPATPLSLATFSCNDRVTLQWKKSTGPDVIRYRIYGGTTANPTIKIDSTTSSALDTVKNISGLTRGQLYYFRVSAVNYDGPESVLTSQVSQTVLRGVVPSIKSKWGDLLICPNVGDSIVSYQWFKNNAAIVNGTSQNYLTNKQPGAYMVEVTDILGCKNISNVVSITGAKSLSVFPNPASGTFALKITDITEGRTNVTLINSSGIKVLELQANSPNDDLLKEIPVRNLNPGIYIIKVLLDNEELYYTKIVITK